MATNKEIIEAIESLQSRDDNANLVLIQSTIDEVKDDIKTIKKQLFNPDDGVIVRVNKNSEFRKNASALVERAMQKIDSWEMELKSLTAWQQTVNKALWICFTAIIGLAVKQLFF